MRFTGLKFYLLKMLTECLTSHSKPFLVPRKKSDEREITVDDDPKLVCLSQPVFKEHKLDNFNTQFNKLRKEFLVKKGK